MMQVVAWIAAILLIVFGLWLILLNWLVFYRSFIQRRPSPSWMPLLGGLLLCAGFLIIPGNQYRSLWWLAFIIDWGSAPGISHAIIWHLLYRQGGTDGRG